MKKTILTILLPPVAIIHYGVSATRTAAPVAVFWIASLVVIVLGLRGGPLNPEGPAWLLLGLGVFMWVIAAIWAELVIKGVEHDLHHDPDSTLDHKIEPSTDEPDPLKELFKIKRRG